MLDRCHRRRHGRHLRRRWTNIQGSHRLLLRRNRRLRRGGLRIRPATLNLRAHHFDHTCSHIQPILPVRSITGQVTLGGQDGMIGTNGIHPDSQIFVFAIGPDGRRLLVQVALRIDRKFRSSGDQSPLDSRTTGILTITGPSHESILTYNGNTRVFLSAL